MLNRNRQTNVKELPYNSWVILNKHSSQIHGAYCTCVSGLSGVCKHVAALLYCLVEVAEKGLNLSCTSKTRQWGKYKKFHEPEFLPQIPIKRLKSNCEIEEIGPRKSRFLFDPRAPCDRNPSGDCVFNLQKLALITNGNAAIIKHLGVNASRACPSESDANVENEEEVVTAPIPLPIVELADIFLNENADVTKNEFPEKIIEEIKVTQEQVKTISEMTKNNQNLSFGSPKEGDESLHQLQKMCAKKSKMTSL